MDNFIKNRRFRIFILIAADICIVAFSALAALALRFDIFIMPPLYMESAIHSIPAYVLIAISVLSVFKLYNRVWSYASLNELISIFTSSLVIEALFIVYHVFTDIRMPRSYYPLNFMVMLILFTAMRFSKVIFNSLTKGTKKIKISRFVMVIGAGSAAAILIKDLKHERTNARVICAIDDNENKRNKYIMGVPIVGDRYDISKNVKKYNITEIIIAMPSIDSESLKEVIDICQSTGKPVKILPKVEHSLTSSVIDDVRQISYEDLLSRKPIRVNQDGIDDFIRDKVVLVTGGGGSIGSELCRQIVKHHPKKLIILDIYENNAYEIQMELERRYPRENISTIIGSVRDYDRMESVFTKYRPDVVYHAAAHKHVPLMEKSPNEAVKNNCLGTLNLAKLADKYEASNFVLISTDKAVRPTNIMGASKRICEMIVQVYARKSLVTRYAAVRFGNVLGSNGSVIPLFLKQIEKGGPVTVTHKEITRFFMTIPEAVSLVLQASLFAKGGEIFVLDMGRPVKIYELAENLIKLKGFKPNEDIDIEIIGLRPGEKLFEEVLMDEEGLDKTENDMIFIGKPIKTDEGKFLKNLDSLIKESMKNGRRIKEMTEDVCGTYTITDNE